MTMEAKPLDNTAGNSASTSSKETHSLAVKTLSTTTDASSGQPLPGVTLSAPIDAKVISPFTTLMNIGGLTSDEIKVAFGIDDQNQINLKDFQSLQVILNSMRLIPVWTAERGKG